MGIQFLNGYDNMQLHYKRPEIPTVSPEELKSQQQTAVEPAKEENIINYSSQEQLPANDLRSRVADLENISLTFNKEDDFDYIGSESGLVNLDMQKAISDMRKDQVLQEYQYFVGSSQNLFQSEDGLVIPKAVQMD